MLPMRKSKVPFLCVAIIFLLPPGFLAENLDVNYYVNTTKLKANLIYDVQTYLLSYQFPQTYVEGFTKRTPTGLPLYLDTAKSFRDSVVGGFPFNELNSAIYKARHDPTGNSSWSDHFESEYIDYCVPAIVVASLGLLIALIFPIYMGLSTWWRNRSNWMGKCMSWSPKRKNIKYYSIALVLCALLLIAFDTLFLIGTSQIFNWGTVVTTEVRNTADLLSMFSNTTFVQMAYVVNMEYTVLSNFTLNMVNLVPVIAFTNLTRVLEPELYKFGVSLYDTAGSMNKTYYSLYFLNISLSETNNRNDALNASLVVTNEGLANVKAGCVDVVNSPFTTPEFTDACNSFLDEPVYTTKNFTNLTLSVNGTLNKLKSFPNATRRILHLGEDLKYFKDTIEGFANSTIESVTATLEEYNRTLNNVVDNAREKAQRILYDDIDIYGVADDVNNSFNSTMSNGITAALFALSILLATGILVIISLTLPIGSFVSWICLKPVNEDISTPKGPLIKVNLEAWPKNIIFYWRKTYNGIYLLLLCCTVFGSLVFLMTAIMYLVGSVVGPACESVVDRTLNEYVLDNPVTFDGYFLAGLVLDDRELVLTTNGVLNSCEINNSSWNSLSMYERYNLTEMLQFNQINLVYEAVDEFGEELIDLFTIAQEEIVNLQEIANTVREVANFIETILPSLPDMGLENVNFTSANLSSYNSAMETLIVASQTLPSDQTVWPNMADDLSSTSRSIVDSMIIEGQVETVYGPAPLYARNSLNGAADFTLQLPTTVDSGLKLVTTFQTEGVVVVNATVNLTNELIEFAFGFGTSSVVFVISDKLAGCNPVYVSYIGSVDALCSYSMEGVDIMWLSAGAMAFLMIPVTILTIILRGSLKRDMSIIKGHESDCERKLSEETHDCSELGMRRESYDTMKRMSVSSVEAKFIAQQDVTHPETEI